MSEVNPYNLSNYNPSEVHFCQIKQLPVSPITSVSVKTVVIDAEMEDLETEDGVIVSGVEDEEMTLTCRASGGPPVPRISWSVPATLRYEVLEEDFDVQVTTKHILHLHNGSGFKNFPKHCA